MTHDATLIHQLADAYQRNPTDPAVSDDVLRRLGRTLDLVLSSPRLFARYTRDLAEVMKPAYRRRVNGDSRPAHEIDMLCPISEELVETLASVPLSLRPLQDLAGLPRIAINPVAMHQLRDWIAEEVPESWMPLLIEDCERECRFEGTVRPAIPLARNSLPGESPTGSVATGQSRVEPSLLLRGMPSATGAALGAAMLPLVPILGAFLGSLLGAVARATAAGGSTQSAAGGARFGPLSFSLVPGADPRATTGHAPMQTDTALTVDVRYGRVDKMYFAAILLGGLGYVVPGCVLSARLLRPTGELIASAGEFVTDEEDQPIELRWSSEGGARGFRAMDRLELSFRRPGSTSDRFTVTLVLSPTA